MKKLTEKDYIERFNKKHDNFYKYNSFPEKYNQKSNIEIICPKHGKFLQKIINHSNGMGCPQCGIEKRSKTKKEKTAKKYKKILNEKYKNQFDFSDADFSNGVDSKIKVKCLNCNKYFYPTIMDMKHDKHHCPYCREKNMKNGYYKNLSKVYEEKFITKSIEIFGEKYDYSKVNYINNYTSVEIICPEHGSFYKRPGDHIYEPKLQGCPYCTAELNKSSHEEHVYNMLLNNNIEFLFNYYELSDEYLKNKPFDFYISKYNLLIEVDGDQHRKPSWGQTNEEFQNRLNIDIQKRKRAEELGYNVLVLETNKMYLSELEKYLEKFNDYPSGGEIPH
jgi:very-short-patch-repair endonuclease